MFAISGLSPEIVGYIVNPPIDFKTLKDTDNIINLWKAVLRGLSKEEVVQFFTFQYLVAGRKPLKRNAV